MKLLEWLITSDCLDNGYNWNQIRNQILKPQLIYMKRKQYIFEWVSTLNGLNILFFLNKLYTGVGNVYWDGDEVVYLSLFLEPATGRLIS